MTRHWKDEEDEEGEIEENLDSLEEEPLEEEDDF